MTAAFVETREYRRFCDFCDACRDNRYIGLCHGPPGVGKTLSARYYANWDEVETFDVARDYPPVSETLLNGQAVFYTAKVNNTPNNVLTDIRLWRARVKSLSLPAREIHLLMEPLLEDAHRRRLEEGEAHLKMCKVRVTGFGFRDAPKSEPTLEQVLWKEQEHRAHIADPTRLVLVDEADRLKIQSLEQVREIFDEGGIGLVLIGMPGIEKKLARYPQLYSRVGFVHEFRPLKRDDVLELLRDQWRPDGLRLPKDALTNDDGLASIIRVTGGNFRLLHRLLTQVARVLELNGLDVATPDVVDAARASLVIGVD